MPHGTGASRHAIDSCTFKLQTWRSFKTLDSENACNNPTSTAAPSIGFHSTRACLFNRATTIQIDSLDISRLRLLDDSRSISSQKRENLRLIARKGRRRRSGSRRVSERCSEWRGGRRRWCCVGNLVAYAACSDLSVAAGTDSSGELCLNGDGNWSSSSSLSCLREAANNSKREKNGGSWESEGLSSGAGRTGSFDCLESETGYGSEPGYGGDAEFGYGDGMDEEEDDQRLFF